MARARVLAGFGQALMLRARFAEAASVCEEAIAVARAAGAPVVEAHAMNSLGTAIARLGEVDRGLACSRRPAAARPSWGRPRTRPGPASTSPTCSTTWAGRRRR